MLNDDVTVIKYIIFTKYERKSTKHNSHPISLTYRDTLLFFTGCFSGVSSLAEVCGLTDAYAGMKYNQGGIFASLYRVIREQQSLL